MGTVDVPLTTETMARLMMAEPPVLLEVLEEMAFRDPGTLADGVRASVLGTRNEVMIPDLLRRLADAVDEGLSLVGEGADG